MSDVGPSRVFVDSNIWISRTLMDWVCLLFLSSTPPPFYAYWTEDVLGETVYHLRRLHPGWPGQRIALIRDRLAETFGADMRVSHFKIDPLFSGRDKNDAHVHSAALACGATYLLTSNLKDFEGGSDDLPYEAIDP